MQANIAKLQLQKYNNSQNASDSGSFGGQGRKFDVHQFLQNTPFDGGMVDTILMEKVRNANIQCQIYGKQGHAAHTCFQLRDLISGRGRDNQS